MFIFLQDRFGGTIAALILAGVYLLFAIICFVALKIMQRPATKAEQRQATFAAATSDVDIGRDAACGGTSDSNS